MQKLLKTPPQMRDWIREKFIPIYIKYPILSLRVSTPSLHCHLFNQSLSPGKEFREILLDIRVDCENHA